MAVSIQQASTNAFVAYLQAKMLDCKVEGRWPAADRKLVSKTITVVASGARRDESLDPCILSKTNQGDTDTLAVYQVAHCYQPYQLDIWCEGYLERDDVMARLDTYLRAGESSLGVGNYMPVGAGCLVNVQDGWDATADFVFENPDTDDTPNSVDQSRFRATYRGGAYFKLTIPAITARQKVITLKLILDGDLFQDAST